MDNDVTLSDLAVSISKLGNKLTFKQIKDILDGELADIEYAESCLRGARKDGSVERLG